MSETATVNQAKYRVLGSNDDHSECCCCGRQGLKRVVWMQPLDEDGNEEGEPVHFGVICAAKAAGWGYGNRSDAQRRIDRERAETTKFYGGKCSARIQQIIDSGSLVKSRVAFAFNWKSATHSYGYIYTLPSDPIIRIQDPVAQQAEIKSAKERAREQFPILAWLDRISTIAEMRTWLKSA